MRVVSHTCSNTEIVCAMGLQDHLIAVDDHSDYPQEIVSPLPKTGKDLQQDIGFIQSLKPDLVLTSLTVPGHEKIVSEMKEAGLPHLVIDPTSIEEVMDSFIVIAEALGAKEKGVLLKNEFQQKIDEIKEQVLAKDVKVMVEWWSKPSIVPCQFSWVNDMIGMAGGKNPWGSYELKSMVVEDSGVCLADPDLLVVAWCGVKAHKIKLDAVYRKKEFENVSAFKNKNIHVISEEYLGRPAPRLLQGLQQLAKLIRDTKK